VRFAGVTASKTRLRFAFWLKRRVTSFRFVRVEQVTDRDWIYRLVIDSESDLDDELLSGSQRLMRSGSNRTVGLW
jgi:hypothetical protein